MSNKRNKQNPIKGFSGKVPLAPTERDEQGNFLRQSVHVRGSHWYSATKGWRVTRAFNQHILLNSLLVKLGLRPVQA
jgi:hypothetical protein